LGTYGNLGYYNLKGPSQMLVAQRNRSAGFSGVRVRSRTEGSYVSTTSENSNRGQESKDESEREY